jgi:hypothetical protein
MLSAQYETEDEPEQFYPLEHQREIYRKSYYKRHDEILAKTRAKREVIKAAKLAAIPVKTPEEIAAEPWLNVAARHKVYGCLFHILLNAHKIFPVGA